MAKQIKIFDTTLRDGEQSPGCSMNLQEKLELARQLELLKVDIIEAGFAISSPGDFKSVQAIANTVKNCSVASLARARKEDIDSAYEAVKGNTNPRIHLFLATSPIHMEYKLKMKPDDVLQTAYDMVKYARSLCPNIEFSAEDATRSELDFLAKVTQKVIEAGATTINIPDTVGYSQPQEMFDRISYLMKNVKNIENIDISVHNHNDLGLGVANSLAAVLAGATQIEATINGIGERAGNSSLEEIVMALNTRKAYYDAQCNVDTTQIYKTSKLLSSIIGVPVQPNKAIVGANAFAHEAGIHQHGMLANRSTYEIMTPQSIGIPANKMVLGKHSGRHALEDRLQELGYSLEKEELDRVFAQFKDLADKKKVVTDNDISALATAKATAGESGVALVDFKVTTGNTDISEASVTLEKNGELLVAKTQGTGPIDALFKSVDKALNDEFELVSYNIRSVDADKDALGEVSVKICYNDDTVVGRGLSTDIIKSSITAYLNAVAKVYALKALTD